MTGIRSFIEIYNFFFLAYLAVYASYNLLCAISGSIQMFKYRRMEKLHNILEHDFFYPMSIIVPAHNEEISIIQTVENLLKLDYRHFEIIVVDDGSTDKTKQCVLDKYPLKSDALRPIRYSVPCNTINEIYTGEVNGISITLISKDSAGCKADAINAGINIAAFPYVVNMDGDEILQKDAFKTAGQALFEDENVVCIGGNIKMSNSVTFEDAMPVDIKMGKNLIVDMQTIEYGRSFVGARIFQNEANMNLIVSGGYGIFKKSVLVEVGGFDTGSKGEDMEMTIRIHNHLRKNRKKYSMKYVPDSVCWTQGPQTMKDLRKQRERWYCGLLQTMFKYKSMIFNPRYGSIGLFMMPYYIIYELLNPFFMLVGWFAIGWTVFDDSINFPYVLYVALLYFGFGVLLTMVSYCDKIYMKKEKVNVKQLLYAFFVSIVDSLFFRLYLSFVSIISVFKIKKILKKWESPARTVVNSK